MRRYKTQAIDAHEHWKEDVREVLPVPAPVARSLLGVRFPQWTLARSAHSVEESSSNIGRKPI